MKKLSLFAILAISALALSACSSQNQSSDSPIQVKTSAGNVSVETVSSVGKAYTLDDIKAHASKSDCWTAIDGNVYDLTSYIASGKHKPVISDGCGRDASAMFAAVGKHSGAQAQNLLSGMKIGTLAK